MRKKDWLRLAYAYIAEVGYWQELHKTKIRIAEEHGVDTELLGTDYFSGPMTSAVESLLGEDFCYWCFDCDRNFNEFNKKVALQDDSHPNVHSLEELYELTQEGK